MFYQAVAIRIALCSCLVVSIFGFYVAKGVEQGKEEPSKSACVTAATNLIAAIARGDASRATSDFDAVMKKALPASTLSTVWAATVAKYGAYADLGDATTDAGTQEAPYVVTVPMRFASGTINGVVACNANGAVAGFHLVVPEASNDKPQASKMEGTVELKADAVRSAGMELGATFYRPTIATPPYPLVVLVGGSGPVDRDETMGGNKPMRDLALGLANSGVAAFAFDKRTFAFPQKPVVNIDGEIVDDAVIAIRHASGLEGIDASRVFVLGHSLGGMIAPRIAQRSGRLAGLILLAPLLEPLDQAYLRQLRYLTRLDHTIDETEQTFIAEAESDQKRLNEVRAGHSLGGRLPLGIPASYWEDLSSYDPIAVAKEVNLPALALFAGRDYQVLAGESKKKLEDGLAGSLPLRTKIYPMLGHTFMFMVDPPDPSILLKPSHVSATVVKDIVAWMAAQKPSSPSDLAPESRTPF